MKPERERLDWSVQSAPKPTKTPIDPTSETGSHDQAARQMAVSPNSGSSRLDCGAIQRQDAKEDIPLVECWLEGTAVKHLGVVFGLIAAGFLSPATAGTITVEQTAFQSVVIGGSNNLALLSYTPFDVADGELKRVDVSFSYFLTLSFLLKPNFVSAGLFDIPIAEPYSSAVLVKTSFTSVFGGLSSSSSTPEPLVVGSNGQQATAQINQAYNYSFSVEQPNYLNSNVGPVLNIGSSAAINLKPLNTDSFLPSRPELASLPFLTNLNVSAISADERITPLNANLNGMMLLTYVYDKTIEVHDPTDPVDPPAVVPLPAGAQLLLSGLALAGWIGRRRRS